MLIDALMLIVDVDWYLPATRFESFHFILSGYIIFQNLAVYPNTRSFEISSVCLEFLSEGYFLYFNFIFVAFNSVVMSA